MHPTLVRIAELFRSEGYALYGVGGMVRNPLMGLPVSDLDVCSAMKPGDVIALCRANGMRWVEKGAAFGMVEIHAGEGADKLLVEHTTFRSDSYGSAGHRPTGVRFSGSLEHDARRRDFTVNALYREILTDELIDPTGGLRDLAAGVLRAVRHDPRETLCDDGLRILRLARFAAELGLEVDVATLDAAREFSHLLNDISAERLNGELSRILLSDARYGARPPHRAECGSSDVPCPWDNAVFYGLELLRATGALLRVLPELAACDGCEQNTAYHRYDVLGHSIRACACAAPSLELRLAALLHDVAKPESLARDGNMYKHPLYGARMARAALTRLKYPAATVDFVCELISCHMYDLNNAAKDATLRKRFALMGARSAGALIELREADVRGSGVTLGEVTQAQRWRSILADMQAERAPLSMRELKCSGSDIMRWLGIPPSKRVGDIKLRLLLHCAVHPEDNRPDRLRRIARDIHINSRVDSF